MLAVPLCLCDRGACPHKHMPCLYAAHSVTMAWRGQHPGRGCGRDREEGTLTSDAAAIQLQPQGDAVVPALRTDAHKACEHWAVDLVENNLRGILVGLKCLQGRGGTNMVTSPPGRKK